MAKSGTIYFSYYLAYAGCAAELAGADVFYLDCIAHEIDRNDAINKIKNSEADMVIVDTSTPSILNDVEFASNVKESLPNAKVLCVGTFPSKNLQDFLELVKRYGGIVDGCLVGEYEQTVYELAMLQLDDFPQVEGVVWIRNGEAHGDNELRKTSESFLNELGFVSDFYKRHLGSTGIKKHFYASITWPYLQLLTARGCPYRCSFCNIPSIGSYRLRSIESVVEEFRWIEKELPYIKEVFIEDDTFPINKKRTIEFCKALMKAKITIRWSCNARVNTDKETLRWMKKAGCRLTCVGFESPSKDALSGVIKRTSVDQQESFMASAKDIGLKVNGCFIVGLPEDTPETIQSTIDYAKHLLPNTAQFYPHMVYPGTGSFRWAQDNGLLEHKEWSLWLTPEGHHNTPLRLNGMSSKDLLSFADEGRRQFYTNPKYIVKMCFQALSSPSELFRMLKAGRSFFPLLLKYCFRRIK